MEKNVRINELLKERGKSKLWLEEKTGASHATILKLTNNQTTSVSFKLLRSICYHLKCSPNDVFTFDYTEKGEPVQKSMFDYTYEK